MHVTLANLSRTLQRTVDHLKEPSRRGGKFGTRTPTYFRSTPRFVQPKDRIPYWSIAPGDSVAVVKGEDAIKNKVGTVERVDRKTNVVFLQEDIFKAKKIQPASFPGEMSKPGFKTKYVFVPRAIHVSNVRLRADYEGQQYTTTRIRQSAPRWCRFLHKLRWKRWGLVPELTSDSFSGWVKVPWVKPTIPKTSPASSLDTKDSLKTTWTPGGSPDELLERRASELKVPDLDLHGGYHSRARKTKRYNERNKVSKDVRQKSLEGLQDRGALI